MSPGFCMKFGILNYFFKPWVSYHFKESEFINLRTFEFFNNNIFLRALENSFFIDISKISNISKKQLDQ